MTIISKTYRTLSLSCCVLHNLCQMKGDSYINNDDVLEHTLQRERERRTQRREEREFHASANTLRDILTNCVNAGNWCFKIKRLQDYKIFNGTKLINNTIWNMSLFGLFSDKHFPVYGQNLQFFPYTGKYVIATSSYVYTRFYYL